MIQKPTQLLIGTVIRNSAGECGTLRTLGWNSDGEMFWFIDWSTRGLLMETLAQMQEYEIV
jgi:hypothetical protein